MEKISIRLNIFGKAAILGDLARIISQILKGKNYLWDSVFASQIKMVIWENSSNKPSLKDGHTKGR